MLEIIKSVNSVVNNFIWGVPAMICIIGVGLLLSVRTKFIQIRKFPYAMKQTIGKIFDKKDAAKTLTKLISENQEKDTLIQTLIGGHNP